MIKTAIRSSQANPTVSAPPKTSKPARPTPVEPRDTADLGNDADADLGQMERLRSLARGKTSFVPDEPSTGQDVKNQPPNPNGIKTETGEDELMPEGIKTGGGADGLVPEGIKTGGGEDEDAKTQEPPSPEEEALEDLDHYYDVFDNPGNADNPDGIISEDDLEEIAAGEYDEETARAYLIEQGVAEEDLDEALMHIEESAQYLLEDDGLRDELDSANGNGTDGRISRGDVSSVVFDRAHQDVQDGTYRPTEAASNRDQIDDGVETMDERTPEVIEQQEAAVLEAIESGEPVEFTNANGETEMVTIVQQQDTGGQTVYEVTDENGHTFTISSELTATENLSALGRIVDYYTQQPPGARDTVDEITLYAGDKPGDDAAADYRRDGDKIRFYEGLDHLNEEVFDHEVGHGVGYEVDGEGESVISDVGGLFGGQDGEGTPDGWSEAIEQDDKRPNEYSETNDKEDFAESWAAYLEAREQGPEALAELEERFPARYAILEETYNELQQG